MSERCWRGECRESCYYPETCAATPDHPAEDAREARGGDGLVERLAAAAVKRAKPHPLTTWNRETQDYEVTHEWGPDDSTMVTFTASDGHDSMRALTFREVFALVADALAAIRDEAADQREREVLSKAADDWQTGEWANAPRKADRIAERLATAQFVTDWLRSRALGGTADGQQDET